MAASALDFVPMGTNAGTQPADLTEHRVRHFWERSDRLLHPPSRRFDDLDLCRLATHILRDHGHANRRGHSALTRALLDHCSMTGRLDLGVWADFKTAHVVEPQQVEPVLVETIGHLCTMSRELTEEVGRLSQALAWRGR